MYNTNAVKDTETTAGKTKKLFTIDWLFSPHLIVVLLPSLLLLWKLYYEAKVERKMEYIVEEARWPLPAVRDLTRYGGLSTYDEAVLRLSKVSFRGKCTCMGHPLKLPLPTKLARLGHFPPASQAGRLAGPVFYTIYQFWRGTWFFCCRLICRTPSPLNRHIGRLKENGREVTVHFSVLQV